MYRIHPRCVCLSAVFVLSTLAGFILPAEQASAQNTIADFYKGKQIRIIVGSAAGGGYDLYARVLAEHLGRYIPGNPSFIVQNQSAAASVVAANDVYVTLPQDGTIIAAFQPGALFDQIVGSQTARFETTKFHWLGSLNQEAAVAFTWHTSKAKTFEDILKNEAVFGTSGPNTTEQYTSVLIHLFDAKIKQVAGYESVARMYPAIERGELEGLTTLWGALKGSVPQWIKDKRINVLVQLAFTKQPDLPDVPLVTDFVTAKYLTPGFKPDETLAILKFITAAQAIAWPYGVGPGVPSDRVQALRTAFGQVVADKDFLAATAKMRREINFLDGESVQKIFSDAASIPKSTLESIATLTKPKRS